MLPSTTDVLICGAGSAGLCAAGWLARYGLECTVLESSDGPLKLGKADGVQCRTVEIFESLGLSDQLLRESYHVNEVTFWNAGEKGIVRTSRTADTPTGLSHMPHVILNQARINSLMIEYMKKWNNQHDINYGWAVTNVHVDKVSEDDLEAYPVTVSAQKDGVEHKIKAKYALVRLLPFFFKICTFADIARVVMGPIAQSASALAIQWSEIQRILSGV